MNNTIALLIAGLLLASASPALADDAPTRLRRFAYLVGANDGGTERVKLRYAGRDAAKVATLLGDLGGVSSTDMVVRTSSAIRDIEAGFADLAAKLAAARTTGARVELIFYYSGHSDERGLLVGGERLGYSALRDKISSMPADVNIAILDSCASGAFTRSKGGKREAAFLVDESSQVTGYAFISSSSADEVAQESDRIAASFFTHYLISGLRGGADTNRDGKVTLNEAYQFAFAETVARTESTVGGAQHPAYNMHLVGTGDVVMTDLRATSASLVLAKDVRGRLFIRDGRGTLVIELSKVAAHPVELGLSPGEYSITLKRDGELYRATITLDANRRSTLTAAAFGRGTLEQATARGADLGGASADDYVDEPVRLSFIPQLSVGGSRRSKTRVGFALNVLVGRGDALRGLEVGGLVNIMDDDVGGVQIGGLANVVGGASRGLRIGGLVNYTGAGHRGMLAGGLANYSGGLQRGLALAGLVNYSGGLDRGAALAGLANYTDGEQRGVAVGGLANYTSGAMTGLQIAGLANAAGRVRGAQIGLVNVAAGAVKGIQIGLVNVAAEADAAIGLVNVVGNGYRGAEAWASDTATLSIGVKLGARHTYSILAFGADDDSFQAGAGLGLHRPHGRFYLDLDAIAFSLFDHDFQSVKLDLLAKLRLAIGYDLGNGVAVFGGPTASAAFEFGEAVEEVPKFTPIGGRDFVGDNVRVRLTPGFFAGVHYRL